MFKIQIIIIDKIRTTDEPLENDRFNVRRLKQGQNRAPGVGRALRERHEPLQRIDIQIECKNEIGRQCSSESGLRA